RRRLDLACLRKQRKRGHIDFHLSTCSTKPVVLNVNPLNDVYRNRSARYTHLLSPCPRLLKSSQFVSINQPFPHFSPSPLVESPLERAQLPSAGTAPASGVRDS